MLFKKLSTILGRPGVQRVFDKIRAADGAFGFWVACVVAGVFSWSLIWFGLFQTQKAVLAPVQKFEIFQPQNDSASLALAPAEQAFPGYPKYTSLTQPVKWQDGKTFNLEGEIVRMDSPFVYDYGQAKRRAPQRFSIELYQVAGVPDTHLHIRQVDYNELGYGGGFKIALEIVERF